MRVSSEKSKPLIKNLTNNELLDLTDDEKIVLIKFFCL